MHTMVGKLSLLERCGQTTTEEVTTLSVFRSSKGIECRILVLNYEDRRDVPVDGSKYLHAVSLKWDEVLMEQ